MSLVLRGIWTGLVGGLKWFLPLHVIEAYFSAYKQSPDHDKPQWIGQIIAYIGAIVVLWVMIVKLPLWIAKYKSRKKGRLMK